MTTMSKQQGITINNVWLSRQAILHHDIADQLPLLPAELTLQLADLLHELLDESSHIRLHSSGSTGEPKQFLAPKQALIASAQRSCSYLRLSAGDSVLLRLPLNYIAAKMMIIRCLVARLHLELRSAQSCLFDPSMKDIERLRFCPIVTQQAAKNSLDDLSRIDTLLLGGGFIPPEIEEKLRSHPGHVYASYGMTETYSHIALRRLNGTTPSARYTPLAGVSLSQDSHGRLIIDDSHLGITKLQTNDIAELDEDGSFLILGRADNVINSGGVKIQSEPLELCLEVHAGVTCVALPYLHPELGTCIALLWEGNCEKEHALRKAIAEHLSPYERPKHIVHSPTPLPRTASQKINRPACQAQLEAQMKPNKP